LIALGRLLCSKVRSVIVLLKQYTWQSLRILARAKNKPVVGSALRHTPIRRTKDGSFLDELVRVGLIAVARPDPGGDPFAHAYVLTDLGRHAAEYGEFEGGFPPRPPV